MIHISFERMACLCLINCMSWLFSFKHTMLYRCVSINTIVNYARAFKSLNILGHFNQKIRIPELFISVPLKQLIDMKCVWFLQLHFPNKVHARKWFSNTSRCNSKRTIVWFMSVHSVVCCFLKAFKNKILAMVNLYMSYVSNAEGNLREHSLHSKWIIILK